MKESKFKVSEIIYFYNRSGSPTKGRVLKVIESDTHTFLYDIDLIPLGKERTYPGCYTNEIYSEKYLIDNELSEENKKEYTKYFNKIKKYYWKIIGLEREVEVKLSK